MPEIATVDLQGSYCVLGDDLSTLYATLFGRLHWTASVVSHSSEFSNVCQDLSSGNIVASLISIIRNISLTRLLLWILGYKNISGNASGNRWQCCMNHLGIVLWTSGDCGAYQPLCCFRRCSLSIQISRSWRWYSSVIGSGSQWGVYTITIYMCD